MDVNPYESPQIPADQPDEVREVPWYSRQINPFQPFAGILPEWMLRALVGTVAILVLLYVAYTFWNYFHSMGAGRV